MGTHRRYSRGTASAALLLGLLGDPKRLPPPRRTGASSRSTPTRRRTVSAAVRVASDSSGNFVVVWQSNGSAGSDTSDTSVQGQRYDASGSPIGGEFQVNTYTTGNQADPSVASDSAGNFVVVWAELRERGQRHIRSPCRASATTRAAPRSAGSSRSTPTRRTTSQVPSVASDSAGNFVVVWESNGSAGSDTSGSPCRASATTRAAPRSAGSSRSTPTRRATSHARRSRATPRATSSWCGRAPGARAATPPWSPCRASATTRAALRSAGSSRSTPTRRTARSSRGRERLRGQLRRGVGEQRERGQRHLLRSPCRASATRERLPARRAVPGQHATRRATSRPVGRERLRGQLRRGLGERRERGQRHIRSPCRASPTTRTAPRSAASSRSTPIRRRPSGPRRSRATPRADVRRGMGEQRERGQPITSLISVQGQRYLPEPSFAPSLGAMLAMLLALARRRKRR